MSFSYGRNNSPENLDRGFNYGFVMEFRNEIDRDFYISHPDHQKIATNEILPLLEDGINSVIVLDF